MPLANDANRVVFHALLAGVHEPCGAELLVISESLPNSHESPNLLLAVGQDFAQRLGLSADLVGGPKDTASGPMDPRLALKRVQKVLDPAPTLESNAELFIGAGLARCLGMQHHLGHRLDSCG